MSVVRIDDVHMLDATDGTLTGQIDGSMNVVIEHNEIAIADELDSNIDLHVMCDALLFID